MFSYISGKVLIKEDNTILIESRDYGITVICTDNTLEKYSIGQEIRLFLEFYIIQESNCVFYGFESFLEKKLFLELKKKTSIVRKTLMKILNYPVDEILSAIGAKSLEFFKNIDGIGTQSAKTILNSMENSELLAIESLKNTSFHKNSKQRELINILVNTFGFEEEDANKLSKKTIDLYPDYDVSTLTKQVILLRNSGKI